MGSGQVGKEAIARANVGLNDNANSSNYMQWDGFVSVISAVAKGVIFARSNARDEHKG